MSGLQFGAYCSECRKSPIGPNDSTSIRTSVVTLEYEMKEYGEARD